MTNRADEFLELMKVEQLTPAERHRGSGRPLSHKSEAVRKAIERADAERTVKSFRIFGRVVRILQPHQSQVGFLNEAAVGH